MATLLNLKEFVATQLGADNASTPVSKRDKIINAARREFYGARQWSFLRKTTTIAITAQVGSFPTDYNDKFPPIAVYTYTGATKFPYTLVDWDDLALYPNTVYVYALDKTTNQIKISTTNIATINFDYTYLPTDHPIDTTDDATAEPAPDITPIGLLAVAKWWLASERATGKYQLFHDQYNAMIGSLIAQDNKSKGVTPIYPQIMRIHSGYRGRGGW